MSRKHLSKRTCLPACKWNEDAKLCSYKRTQPDGSTQYKLCGAAPEYRSSIRDLIKPETISSKQNCNAPCKWLPEDSLCTYKRTQSNGSSKYKLCRQPASTYVDSLQKLRDQYVLPTTAEVAVQPAIPSVVPTVPQVTVPQVIVPQVIVPQPTYVPSSYRPTTTPSAVPAVPIATAVPTAIPTTAIESAQPVLLQQIESPDVEFMYTVPDSYKSCEDYGATGVDGQCEFDPQRRFKFSDLSFMVQDVSKIPRFQNFINTCQLVGVDDTSKEKMFYDFVVDPMGGCVSATSYMKKLYNFYTQQFYKFLRPSQQQQLYGKTYTESSNDYFDEQGNSKIKRLIPLREHLVRSEKIKSWYQQEIPSLTVEMINTDLFIRNTMIERQSVATFISNDEINRLLKIYQKFMLSKDPASQFEVDITLEKPIEEVFTHNYQYKSDYSFPETVAIESVFLEYDLPSLNLPSSLDALKNIFKTGIISLEEFGFPSEQLFEFFDTDLLAKNLFDEQQLQIFYEYTDKDQKYFLLKSLFVTTIKSLDNVVQQMYEDIDQTVLIPLNQAYSELKMIYKNNFGISEQEFQEFQEFLEYQELQSPAKQQPENVIADASAVLSDVQTNIIINAFDGDQKEQKQAEEIVTKIEQTKKDLQAEQKEIEKTAAAYKSAVDEKVQDVQQNITNFVQRLDATSQQQIEPALLEISQQMTNLQDAIKTQIDFNEINNTSQAVEKQVKKLSDETKDSQVKAELNSTVKQEKAIQNNVVNKAQTNFTSNIKNASKKAISTLIKVKDTASNMSSVVVEQAKNLVKQIFNTVGELIDIKESPAMQDKIKIQTDHIEQVEAALKNISSTEDKFINNEHINNVTTDFETNLNRLKSKLVTHYNEFILPIINELEQMEKNAAEKDEQFFDIIGQFFDKTDEARVNLEMFLISYIYCYYMAVDVLQQYQQYMGQASKNLYDLYANKLYDDLKDLNPLEGTLIQVEVDFKTYLSNLKKQIEDQSKQQSSFTITTDDQKYSNVPMGDDYSDMPPLTNYKHQSFQTNPEAYQPYDEFKKSEAEQDQKTHQNIDTFINKYVQKLNKDQGESDEYIHDNAYEPAESKFMTKSKCKPQPRIWVSDTKEIYPQYQTGICLQPATNKYKITSFPLRQNVSKKDLKSRGNKSYNRSVCEYFQGIYDENTNKCIEVPDIPVVPAAKPGKKKK